MISEKNRNTIWIVLHGVVGLIFIILYPFNPFERNNEITIFDGFIMFVMVTILTFIPRLKAFSNYSIIGYMIYLIIRYFL